MGFFDDIADGFRILGGAVVAPVLGGLIGQPALGTQLGQTILPSDFGQAPTPPSDLMTFEEELAQLQARTDNLGELYRGVTIEQHIQGVLDLRGLDWALAFRDVCGSPAAVEMGLCPDLAVAEPEAFIPEQTAPALRIEQTTDFYAGAEGDLADDARAMEEAPARRGAAPLLLGGGLLAAFALA